jgi:hypothetical protein
MTRKVSLPIEGGCQCGALRYQITAPPLMIYACHCANCQRIAGSAFGLATTITEDSLEFTAGEPHRVAWRSDAGNERYGTFCGACGCRIAHGQTPSNGILSLRAGTLDDVSWVVPAGHIWAKSAQPWFEFNASDILWDGQPTDYVPLIQKFKAGVAFEEKPTGAS